MDIRAAHSPAQRLNTHSAEDIGKTHCDHSYRVGMLILYHGNAYLSTLDYLCSVIDWIYT